MKQIGIFGGSFDPIHLGHLNLAIEMMEKRALDEIWFCPTAYNPLKKHQTEASAADRMQMLQLAVEGYPRFKILDIEISQKGPCYTIDTLRRLAGDGNKFSFIVGEDSARSFHKWHEPEEIIKLARILVGRRLEQDPLETDGGSVEVRKALTAGMTPTQVMDISSTEIRKRISSGLYCGHLLPAKVLDYILAHGLYSSKQLINH